MGSSHHSREYEWGAGMGGRENVGWVGGGRGGGRVQPSWKERMGTLCSFWRNSLSPIYKTQCLLPMASSLPLPRTFWAVCSDPQQDAEAGHATGEVSVFSQEARGHSGSGQGKEGRREVGNKGRREEQRLLPPTALMVSPEVLQETTGRAGMSAERGPPSPWRSRPHSALS